MLAGWGIDIANDLEVDASGLRIAAASSDDLAAGLAGATGEGPPSNRRSRAGVQALDAAITEMSDHQSDRITGQADDIMLVAARYDETDGDGAVTLAV